MTHADDPFLAAIRAAPADTLPRLVYADWLDENGHGTFAAFIRVCIEIAAWEPMRPDDRKDLRRTRYTLWQRMQVEYRDAFSDMPVGVADFDAGVGPDFVAAFADAFCRASPHWWPVLAPRVVRLFDADMVADRLPDAMYFRHVVDLDLTVSQPRWRMTYDDRGSEELVCDPLRGDLLTALAAVPEMPNLDRLTIGECGATPDQLRALAGASWIRRPAHVSVLLWYNETTQIALETPTPGSFPEVVAMYLGGAIIPRVPTP